MSRRRHVLPLLWLVCVVVMGVCAGSALAAPPEVPLTLPATAVSATEATLNGELNPHVNASAGYFFLYNVGGECTGGFATAFEAELTGEGIPVTSVPPVEGLVPSTEYMVCTVAAHTEGEETEFAIGLPVSFTTAGVQPAVSSVSVSAVTPFDATFEGVLNPENAETTYRFQYATDEAFTQGVGTAGETVLPPGIYGELPVGPVDVGGTLAAGTTYYYRIIAENATGVTDGAIEHFTTLAAEAPAVDSEKFSGLTSTDAILEGQVNPNYQATTYHFQYATDEAFTQGVKSVGAGSLPAGFGDQPVTLTDIGGGLAPGTTYFYRLVAENATGTTNGTSQVQSFQTLNVPVPTTGQAANITRTSAMFTGSVNAAGTSTSYYVSYIDEAGYNAAVAEGSADPYAKGGSTPPATATGSYTPQPTNPLTANELRPGVTYYFALVATNSVGTVIGAPAKFTTLAPIPPPVATTGGALNITQGTATITGSINTNGLPTTASFEFGPTPHSGTLLGTTRLPASPSPAGVSFAFNGYLTPGTTYYYRVIATSEAGTASGAEGSFTTTAPPSAITAPTTPLLSYPAEPKALTNAQKLANALKACHKKKGSKRKTCERQAHKHYPTTKKK